MALFFCLIKHNVSDNIVINWIPISDILHYIAEHPFFSLILLGIIVLAFGLAPFSSSSIENKRSAIINKHYNDNFKK